jgi:hypothetical protein
LRRTQISFDELEYAAVEQAAGSLGLSVAEFVRRAVRESLRRGETRPWMTYAGMVQTGNSRSSQLIDEVVYGRRGGMRT